MNMDCNLKKYANIFKFFSCIINLVRVQHLHAAHAFFGLITPPPPTVGAGGMRDEPKERMRRKLVYFGQIAKNLSWFALPGRNYLIFLSALF